MPEKIKHKQRLWINLLAGYLPGFILGRITLVEFEKGSSSINPRLTFWALQLRMLSKRRSLLRAKGKEIVVASQETCYKAVSKSLICVRRASV